MLRNESAAVPLNPGSVAEFVSCPGIVLSTNQFHFRVVRQREVRTRAPQRSRGLLKRQYDEAVAQARESGFLNKDLNWTALSAHYDKLIADLVNYLVFMSEPARERRVRIGYAVLIFLGVLFVPVYLLKKEYWKDVH